MTADEIMTYMESLRDEKQRQVLMRFFKTAPGEYGYGDEFLGIKVPQTREVVKLAAPDTPLSEIPELLMCRWHEVRLCGLLLLVWRFEKLATKRLVDDEEAILGRDRLLKLYLSHAEQANNWDLVDMTAPKILGHWLMLPSSLGDRSFKQDQLGDASWCLRYAERHLQHPHDLMHKAVGWMLREMGKRVSTDLLRDFLSQHIHKMPRTTLRYAIEKLEPVERQYWMSIPRKT